MIKAKSYSRLTLALDIIKKLTSGKFTGYHELNIIKQQIELHDTISIRPANQTKIICNDPRIPNDKSNLCWQVVDLLKNKYHISKNVEITIEKNIPPESGLAAGSSNAATTLKLLNQLWQLKIPSSTLIQLARQIGMDVPFFIYGHTCFDTEATRILNPIPTQTILHYIIILPDFGVSTKEAYQNIDYSQIGQNTLQTKQMKTALEKNDIQSVINNIHDDFELSVFPQFPKLNQIKQDLISAGCAKAFMTGSGSTMVGITTSQNHSQEILYKLKNKYQILISKTKEYNE
ncbi:4-(cytidine 5'-diphospho)-2-C-methyl-D-erythritol kinase [Patescibacteria group bacterium]|nr:4-(cytidine 5'-diphospho)-2-C-methyl-D-erythritol kinase [Patescibacteria group bacterium]